MMLIASAHAVGWPVAEGGSGAITRALAARLAALGGTIETGVRVDSIEQLPPARAVLLDLAPRDVVRIAGDRMPDRVAQVLSRYRHGPAAFKLDLAVEGGIPWTAEACRRAGTVHVGGTLEEIAASEAEVHRGRMPARPFMLVGQQYLADPGTIEGRRAPDLGVRACARRIHRGRERGDALPDRAVRAGLPRPHRRPTRRDAGRHRGVQPELRRRRHLDRRQQPVAGPVPPATRARPLRHGTGNVFICSAATPPGAGVHGMCGANAALSALRVLRAG